MQVSWHIHDDDKKYFKHLDPGVEEWDGHDTDEKYRRLQAIKALADKEWERTYIECKYIMSKEAVTVSKVCINTFDVLHNICYATSTGKSGAAYYEQPKG